MNKAIAALLALAALAAVPATAGAAPLPTRPVLLVGNNWDGTADVLDVPTFRRLDRINIVPDRAARMAEIMLDPVAFGTLLFTREMVGEGHDQFVDDMFASHDGRTIYVSRPSFDDVVAIDLATKKIVWRTKLTGARADHAAISPDGTRFVVSSPALAGQSYVDVLDTATGNMVGKFPSGDTPHENNFSRDGNLIYHASIGRVYTPTDSPALDATKGERVFEIVDAHTLKVLKKINMAQKLAEFGMPGMSAAVRPMALSPDEHFVYFQVSFFHGFVEYDLRQDKVTRVARLPIPDAVRKLRRDQYILDSAHHGIAMNGAGTKLCVAGTMSNYAAIVSRETFRATIHPLGARTYWATTSADGKYCYVSVAGDDTMSIISYATEQEVARIPVGDHPQRARTANVATAIYGAPPAAGRARARALSLHVQPARDPRAPFRFGLAGRLVLPAGIPAGAGCRGTVRVELRRLGRLVASRDVVLRRRAGRCTYATRLGVPARAAGVTGAKRLVARARFRGNMALLPASSRGVLVRIR